MREREGGRRRESGANAVALISWQFSKLRQTQEETIESENNLQSTILNVVDITEKQHFQVGCATRRYWGSATNRYPAKGEEEKNFKLCRKLSKM